MLLKTLFVYKITNLFNAVHQSLQRAVQQQCNDTNDERNKGKYQKESRNVVLLCDIVNLLSEYTRSFVTDGQCKIPYTKHKGGHSCRNEFAHIRQPDRLNTELSHGVEKVGKYKPDETDRGRFCTLWNVLGTKCKKRKSDAQKKQPNGIFSGQRWIEFALPPF